MVKILSLFGIPKLRRNLLKSRLRYKFLTRIKEIGILKAKIEKEYVPRVTKEKLDQTIKELQVLSTHYRLRILIIIQ
jgi:hypothetical protein